MTSLHQGDSDPLRPVTHHEVLGLQIPGQGCSITLPPHSLCAPGVRILLDNLSKLCGLLNFIFLISKIGTTFIPVSRVLGRATWH